MSDFVKLAVLSDLNVTTFVLSNSLVLGERIDGNLGFSGAILVTIAELRAEFYESFKNLAWDTIENSKHVRKADHVA